MLKATGVWGDHQIFYLGNTKKLKIEVSILNKNFSNFLDAALTIFCSELISKWLLRDEDLGRNDVQAMEYLESTELSRWLLDKIKELGNT